MSTEHPASGVLQLNAKGFGFLRQAATNYLPSSQDVLVPRTGSVANSGVSGR
ncbi:MAG: hypothetical protein AB7N91_33290 [Candidatus Tectimicrobiota bacterium]